MLTPGSHRALGARRRHWATDPKGMWPPVDIPEESMVPACPAGLYPQLRSGTGINSLCPAPDKSQELLPSSPLTCNSWNQNCWLCKHLIQISLPCHLLQLTFTVAVLSSKSTAMNFFSLLDLTNPQPTKNCGDSDLILQICQRCTEVCLLRRKRKITGCIEPIFGNKTIAWKIWTGGGYLSSITSLDVFPPWLSLIIGNISLTSSNPASTHDY